MRRISIVYGVLILLSSSCATLNISDIKNLEKKKFDSLILLPAWEANNLRIDLIRQTFEEGETDSAKVTKERPYHPLGFDLGNGLFYDLNENLCLRLDYLLDFSEEEDFEIRKTTKPLKNKGLTIYKYKNDSLLLQYPPREKIHYRYHKINGPDSMAFMYKKRLVFALVKTDSTLIYSGEKRKWDVIHKTDNAHYYLNKKKWKEEYKLENNEVFLENNYIVRLTNDDSGIEIVCPRRRRKDRVIYTIEKDSDRMYIYNNNYSGLMIEKRAGNILIYRDETLLKKYELKSGTDNKPEKKTAR